MVGVEQDHPGTLKRLIVQLLQRLQAILRRFAIPIRVA